MPYIYIEQEIMFLELVTVIISRGDKILILSQCNLFRIGLKTLSLLFCITLLYQTLFPISVGGLQNEFSISHGGQ